MGEKPYGVKAIHDGTCIEELDSARALIGFLRIQQHDFMNHIQVIHGYLQLNKPQRAMEYIEELTAQKQNLSGIYKLLDPEMAACLIAGLTKAAFHQVEMEFDLSTQWSIVAENRKIAGLCTELLYLGIEATADLSERVVVLRLQDSPQGHQFRLEIPETADGDHLTEEVLHIGSSAAVLGCRIECKKLDTAYIITCEVPGKID